MTRILAIANHKGGVGKTTTTFNLAGHYASQGARVLVCDLDPQASLTKLFGFNPATARPSLTELLLDDSTPPEEAIHATQLKNVSLIPSNPDLAHAEKQLITRIGREKVLSRILRPMAEAFDLVLLDCPPALDLLNTNGLAAAYDVLVPVESSTLAAQALPEFLRTIEDIRREVNPELREPSFFITKHQSHTAHSQHVLALLKEQFPNRVHEAHIPHSVVAKDSVAASVPAVTFNPRSSVAEAYRLLAEEITHHA